MTRNHSRQWAVLTPASALAAIVATCWIVLLVWVFSACTTAEAAEAPTLRLVQQERPVIAVAGVMRVPRRVAATWNPACDALGCADRYAIAWQLSTAEVPLRRDTITGTETAVTVAGPLPGDTLVVTLTLRAQRRGLWSPPASASITIVGPADAPPPAPGDIKLDTLPFENDSIDALFDTATFTLAIDAWQYRHPDTDPALPDSVPVRTLDLSRLTPAQRDSLGNPALEIPPDAVVYAARAGYVTHRCAVVAYRASGERVVTLPSDLTPAQAAAHFTLCDRATRATVGQPLRHAVVSPFPVDRMFYATRLDGTRIDDPTMPPGLKRANAGSTGGA
jgi:hypothetical protein